MGDVGLRQGKHGGQAAGPRSLAGKRLLAEQAALRRRPAPQRPAALPFALCAAVGCGIACGVPLKDIVAGIEAVDIIPGRSEVIDEGQPFSVIVSACRQQFVPLFSWRRAIVHRAEAWPCVLAAQRCAAQRLPLVEALPPAPVTAPPSHPTGGRRKHARPAVAAAGRGQGRGGQARAVRLWLPRHHLQAAPRGDGAGAGLTCRRRWPCLACCPLLLACLLACSSSSACPSAHSHARTSR